MKEFFGWGGFTRTPEGAMSWQHLTFVTSLMVAMVLLALFLGKRYKNQDLKAKNKVMIWAAILIDGFELIKIVLACAEESSFEPLRRMLPLFLCSIQLIAIPVAAFTKGKLKNAALDFVMIFGILGAVLGTYGATQNYNAYPVLSFPNVVSGITHTISGFASLYIIFSRMASMKQQNIPICLAILTAFCVLAYVANVTLKYNYMFLMSHDGTPYSIFYNMVNGNRVLYPIVVVLLFFVYILSYYGIYFLIVRKKEAQIAIVQEEASEALLEAAATEAPEATETGNEQ